MALLNQLITLGLGSRLRAIERTISDPLAVQAEQFAMLVEDRNLYLAQFGDVSSYEKFRAAVPVVDYSGIESYVDRIRAGERDVLWAGSPTLWAAKSSGTTSGVSKYIPITKRYLQNCHYQGGRDVMALAARNFPDTKAFSGKTMTLGGSAVVEREGGLKVGDLSATLIENTPLWISPFRAPKKEVALIADFDQKVEEICRQTVAQSITAFAGVPSWNLVLMNRVLEYTGKKNLLEVWPNLSLFIHGGVAFTPYRTQFEAIIPSSDMKYMETYNASEGFFAVQDNPADESLLLMLDYEIFYEFVPVATLDDMSTVIPLEGVKVGVNYAMIISSSCGLWRYMIGDTVEFTSTTPYRIKITGRTKHFINVFGEEVIVDNADKALASACAATGAVVLEYTVAPIFMEGRQKGSHEWVVEFSTEPSDIGAFARALDDGLRAVNSDYDAKRVGDATLTAPTVTVVSQEVFHRWMESRGKVGGQNKVPRLSNDRKYVDDLLSLL